VSEDSTSRPHDPRRSADGADLATGQHVVRVGTSGWSYAHWRIPVYDRQPSSRWLASYAERFSTVEVNSTFYRLPTRRMVRRWVEETPGGFIFAVKVSRYLTHIRRLTDVAVHLPRLLELLEPLADSAKLGPLLWQLPPTFTRDDGRLAATLEALGPGRHAFEFRHESWFCPPVLQLLREAGVALVLADDARRPLPDAGATTDWRYVRFHYGHRGRRGNYSPTELARWASRIRGWREAGDVYAYFNNDWEAFAVRNAEQLNRRLRVPAAQERPAFATPPD
jgi:uncharacterized protein YecE (DUF72 family)